MLLANRIGIRYHARVADEVHIIIYDDFADDWNSLESEAQAQGKALFTTLQFNPYEPELQRKCIIHDELFEYPLQGGYSIFWKVHTLSILKMEVLVVAIDRSSN